MTEQHHLRGETPQRLTVWWQNLSSVHSRRQRGHRLDSHHEVAAWLARRCRQDGVGVLVVTEAAAYLPALRKAFLGWTIVGSDGVDADARNTLILAHPTRYVSRERAWKSSHAWWFKRGRREPRTMPMARVDGWAVVIGAHLPPGGRFKRANRKARREQALAIRQRWNRIEDRTVIVAADVNQGARRFAKRYLPGARLHGDGVDLIASSRGHLVGRRTIPQSESGADHPGLIATVRPNDPRE